MCSSRSKVCILKKMSLSLQILTVLLTVATVSLSINTEKKEKFLIVVKGNDEKNSTTPEVKHTNTTRLENISLEYKHDFQKLNKTGDDAKKMYKFEARDGRIYKRDKAASEEVTQEPNYSNDNHVLSLPPPELQQRTVEETQPEKVYVYQPNPYMAFKLCPIPLENIVDDTTSQEHIHYVPQPYLYQAPPKTGYRVPKKMVIRYKPIIEVVEDSAEDLESNPFEEVLVASYGPISGNGFMVVYPNGMAKMIEPVHNGMVGNYLQPEPTGFGSDGVYYHDGLKEYEFQMEDKPAFANDGYRSGKAIQYANSESFKDNLHGINDGHQSNINAAQDPQFYTYTPTYTQENIEYRPVANTYEQNVLHSNADQYTHGYNQEYSGYPNIQGNMYATNVTPAANLNYGGNTATVTDYQYLLPSKNTVSESNVQYTPSLDNGNGQYGNANLAGYNRNINQYQANTNNGYEQQNYRAAANHKYQHNDATKQNNAAVTQNHNVYSHVNVQNNLHNNNLQTAAPNQQNSGKRTAASGSPTMQ